ncbi:G5 domain-containing protein [Nocardioides sp.]|uniref:G5 domain-containing protein n=1 Tax=Nocardioides sp. TaxID=35761 RepID=UPI00271A1BE0|nr:G5 domain-containing protein [Nocardioides sp.]MDO9456923.1 G5 domain-containing protein [Nocardioides sp.]
MTTHQTLRRLPVVVALLAVVLTGCATPVTGRAGVPDAPGQAVASTTTPATPETSETPISSPEPKAPTITYRTVRQRQRLPFERTVRMTGDLDRGVTRLARAGRAGVRVLVFRVKLRDGRPVGRQRVRTMVARRPVTRVVLRGTHVDPPPEPKPRPAPVAAPQDDCDPNYSGACVPIDSDVDCGGGSGNGPSYLYGTATVVGSDIYDLDADNDGYGCE